MQSDKCIQEFVVPRQRVTTEVSRAFQSVLVSLRNLERKVLGLSKTPEAVPELRKEIQTVKETIRRTERQQVQVISKPAETGRNYSTVIGES